MQAALSEKSLVYLKSKTSFVWILVMWGLAATFYFYDYLLQVSPSAMKPELMLAFVRHAEDFGSLSAYFLYAYGLLQIPAGVLLDRFGPKRIITVACVLCAVGSLLFGEATTLWQAKIARFLMGAGAGFALLTCLKIARDWFPPQRYAMMAGLTVVVGFLGAAFGLSSISEVVTLFGWRKSLIWGGFLGLGLALLLWIFVQDKKNTLHHSEQNLKTMTKGLGYVIRDKQTWIASLFAGLMFVPTLVIGGIWGIPFLVEAHGLDRITAGQSVSLIYIGWMAGGAVWGLISDHFQKRILPLLVANIGAIGVTFILIYTASLPFPLMNGLLFLLGFFSSAFILAFAVIVEINPPQFSATASGFGNALNTLWGALAQPFIGLLLDLQSKTPSLSDGEQVFSLAQYQLAFSALPLCLLLSFAILLFLKETHARSKF